MARVVLNAGWIADLDANIHTYLDAGLGPAIAADARRYAPVGVGPPEQDDVPGFLEDSIGWSVKDQTLYVYALAYYAGWVELGHRVYHPTSKALGPDVVPPQPFLRPALYKYRPAGV